MKEFMANPIVPKESQVVTSCLRFLNGVGIFAWRNNNSGTYRGRRAGKDIYSFRGIHGVSDIIGVFPSIIMDETRNQNIENKYAGRIICVECKRPGKLNGQSEGQIDFQEQIEKNGGIYILCDSWEMLESKLKQLNIIK
jgi:hypothetical protein